MKTVYSCMPHNRNQAKSETVPCLIIVALFSFTFQLKYFYHLFREFNSFYK